MTETAQTTLLYIDPAWQQRLADSGLDNFDALWDLDLTAVDEGNTGRGQAGWSRVSIHTLHADPQPPTRIVIKRQSNYFSRTWQHPVRGILTFVKELANIRLYQQKQVPAMTAVYCATRKSGREQQAILVTSFLEDYQSLESLLAQWQDTMPTRQERSRTIQAVAQLVAHLHNAGLEHRCLFPKHIFLNTRTTPPQACLIDLEKTRLVPWRRDRRERDLTALVRRWPRLRPRDAVLFLRAYSGKERLGTDGKALWQRVVRRIRNKQAE
ncbi:MAG: hypothetical protein JXR59_07830 [Desulfuromonadaceae bacterium]|nr:hypothetical protein [Desulfuromonadaceae bacterium]